MFLETMIGDLLMSLLLLPAEFLFSWKRIPQCEVPRDTVPNSRQGVFKDLLRPEFSTFNLSLPIFHQQ